LRVGVVGLGAGTLAAYGRRQDSFCFYEIDPAIKRISFGPKATFTFLNQSAAKVNVVLGDARVSLEREAAAGDFQKFDILILDAFSSDSVPVHLLTEEAVRLYLRHLRGPESVIAFHITNRILDLSPVLRGMSRAFHLDLAIVKTDDGDVSYACQWGFLSQDHSVLHFRELEQHLEPALSDPPVVLWTDDYSNLFSLVKTKAWW
jgi:spermidine synthase